MTQANSCPISYHLVPLGTDHGDYAADSHWAQPDRGHAARMMRELYEDRSRAKEIGLRGQHDIRKALSPAAVGRLMKKRFAALEAFGKIPGPKVASASERIARIARSILPAHVRVSILTDGIRSLPDLNFGGRVFPFPQNDRGESVDPGTMLSSQLIAHLQVVHERRSQFLIVPSAPSDLLEGKTEFEAYLNLTQKILHEDGDCKIYELRAGSDDLSVIPLQLIPEETDGVESRDQTWVSAGQHCNMVLPLGTPKYVSAIRLVYSHRAKPGDVSMLRLFWELRGHNEFDEQRCTNLRQHLEMKVQNRLVIINETIDRIRLDPDIKPSLLERLEISLIVPKDRDS